MATRDSMMGQSTNASLRDRRCDRKDIVGPVQGGYDCVVISISMLIGMDRVICGSEVLIENSKSSIC